MNVFRRFLLLLLCIVGWSLQGVSAHEHHGVGLGAGGERSVSVSVPMTLVASFSVPMNVPMSMPMTATASATGDLRERRASVVDAVAPVAARCTVVEVGKSAHGDGHRGCEHGGCEHGQCGCCASSCGLHCCALPTNFTFVPDVAVATLPRPWHDAPRDGVIRAPRLRPPIV
jgi:hypothetical protein